MKRVFGRMRASAPLIINGRFLSAEATGVQRVAAALLKQLLDHPADVAATFPGGIRIAAPRWSRSLVAAKPRAARIAALLYEQLWEQIWLPLTARGSILLTLSNAAPLAAGRGITMIHDAQSFTTESSYSGWFARWYRFLLPRLGARNLRILTVSRFSADQLASFGVASADRITVIPNGADHVLAFARDPAIIARLGLAERPYVVALSSTQTHKNIAVLLEAFSTIDPAELTLVLAGSADRAQFEEIGLTVPPGVVFAGKVSDAELRALLEQARCAATPSLTEGFGLPPLEAMLLGCPAVVAPCAALPEVCGDGALYADPCTPQEWRDAFSRLADDDVRRTMIERGFANARQYTWAAAGQQLIATLRQCAAIG